MSWRRAAAAAVGVAAFLQAAVCADAALRARSALLEGEKWLEWSRRPDLMRASLDAELEARLRRLQGERDAGRMADDDFQRRLALARFERDQALRRDARAYARVWFESAARLFTPPETRWSARARARLKELD